MQTATQSIYTGMLYSIVRRARLAGVSRRPLTLTLSPEESTTLADVLTTILEDDQSWYWTEAWQASERAAEEDVAARKGEDFETMETFLEDMGLDLAEVRAA